MGWATLAIERLERGETVVLRPRRLFDDRPR
jgi:hypothetical protein